MNKLLRYLLTVTVFLCAVTVLCTGASAVSFDPMLQSQSNKAVELYSKKEYEGNAAEFGIGEYADVDFRSKSISIPTEYTVIAYSEKNFEGREYVLNESQSSYLRFEFGVGLTYIKGIKSMKVGLIESDEIDITDIDDAKKNQIMIDYAPRVYMAEGEPYGTASMDFVYERFDRVADDNGVYRLVMKDEMKHPWEIIDLFYGDHENSEAYAFWIEKEGGYIDISYFQYCPFDSGKYIWLIGCMAGAHAGDWEHFTIRFMTYERNGREYMRPVKAAFPAHTFAMIESWEDLEMFDPTHCAIYCAAGSHGMYPHVGDHAYLDLGPIFRLVDSCTKGEPWDLWETDKLATFEHTVPDLEDEEEIPEGCRALNGSEWADCFSYDVFDPDGLAVRYWGDESWVPPFFNGGPTGPQYKTELTNTTAFK
ncbi:MAG: Vps62-related protein [Clostridia bacterium]|nr:Vps62-related protein [Clostridia bacterium]